MGNRERNSRLAKRGVRAMIELHKEMNPERGQPILIAIDPSTGQLFFCSSKKNLLARDQLRAANVRDMVYEAWPQLRPSD